MFGDGEYYGGTNKYMRAPLKDSPVTDGDSRFRCRPRAGTQAFRPSGFTNVAFCDGHAESLSARYTTPAPRPSLVRDRIFVFDKHDVSRH
jgi:prepilin-type processing-associated H-X9-DG protein